MNSSISSRKSKKRTGPRTMKTDITEDSARQNNAPDSLITPVSPNKDLKPVSHLLNVKKEVELQTTQVPILPRLSYSHLKSKTSNKRIFVKAPDLLENDSIRTAVE
ncbi:hypothetical protein ANCCAN_27717 [Ancylostoma caninum]|uniref:Uncharacterized protein n=1 Tax=Ancylostoma caninum TaxID=29170 RepID=A0A368F389_ANCCA|nr:hypothetical protein ANCCAN_27717 [Ancylostoma caninum]